MQFLSAYRYWIYAATAVILLTAGVVWVNNWIADDRQAQRDHQDQVWRAEIAKANLLQFEKQAADAKQAQQDAIDRGVAAGVREAQANTVVKEIVRVTPANCVYDERSAALLNRVRQR